MADETGNDSGDDFDVPFDEQAEGPEPASGAPDPGPGQEPAAGAKADDAAGSGFPPELAETLRRENLAIVPGETAIQAYARLNHHFMRRSARHYKELTETKRQNEASLHELRNELRPMLMDHARRHRQAQIEEAAAQIPPKDSPEYQVWLQEETLRRLDEKEQQEETRAEQAQRQAAERQRAEALAEIDNRGLTKIVQGLGLDGSAPDPDFVQAYDYLGDSGFAAFREMYPNATDEEVQEAVGLSQRIDARIAEANGIDVRELYKRRMNRMIDGLVAKGLVTRSGAAGGNGSGSKSQSTVAQQPAKIQQAQQTTAQRVTADAQAAARRAPAAVPSTTRASAAAGSLPDVDQFDNDEDFVEAALAGLLGNEEQRVAGHRRAR